MATKKRVLSVKQKAALAKGRAAMTKKRAGKSSKKGVKKKAVKKTVKKTVKRSPAQRAARKDKNTKPGYYPNPLTVYIIGAKNKINNKRGYYNGGNKLEAKNKAQVFTSMTLAKQTGLNLSEKFIQFQWFIETIKKK